MADNHAKEVINEFFKRVATAQDTLQIAELVSPNVDWFIAGDTLHVPWIGKKVGRKGAAEFYSQIRAQIRSEQFVIGETLAHDNRVLVTGSLASRVIRTGKLINTEFIFDFTVKEGLITRFRLFEDSYAVSQACI